MVEYDKVRFITVIGNQKVSVNVITFLLCKNQAEKDQKEHIVLIWKVFIQKAAQSYSYIMETKRSL